MICAAARHPVKFQQIIQSLKFASLICLAHFRLGSLLLELSPWNQVLHPYEEKQRTKKGNALPKHHKPEIKKVSQHKCIIKEEQGK